MKRTETRGVVVRCAPGLARVLQLEMRYRKCLPRGARPLVLHQRNHDLVLSTAVGATEPLAALRIADDAGECLVRGRFKVTASQLDRVAAACAGRDPWRLLVTAAGDHFNRMDVERFFARSLGERRVRVVEEAARVLWVHLIDESFYVVRQTFSRVQAHDRARAAERKGSLPTTVAAALAFAAELAAGERVLDPVCGSGTLLAEAHAKERALGALLGFDVDADAVRVARANLRELPRVDVRLGDGAATGLDDGSVDVVLANLPFGKQFGDVASNPALYRRLLVEMRRVLRADRGRALLLTSDGASLAAALRAFGDAECEELFTVRIRGEAARAFRIEFGP